MYTYNVYFETVEKLEEFIEDNKIVDSENLLIQIFSGILEEVVMTNITTTLLKRLPSSKIVGATTSGEILDDKVSDNQIVISFSIFEKSTLKISCVDNTQINDSFEVGKQLASSLRDDKSKVFILFASGLTVNGDIFLDGIHAIAPNVTISGGLSGDNATFIKTYVIYENQLIENGAVGVSINSDELIVHNDYSLAWQSIGKSFVVEEAKDNILYKVGGMTPKDLYEKYLGIDVAKLIPSSSIGIEFPLIIQGENNVDVCRAIFGVQEDGSFILVGNIQEGDVVKFAVGNLSLLVDGSHHLASRCSKHNAQSIFIYSCMARKVFLESNSYLDIQDFSKIANVSGFFTYGEFYSNNEKYSLLNQTLTMLALSEESLDSKNIDIDPDFDNVHNISRQNALSHLINTTSKELDELNNELETKVYEKTKELQELNESLEKKIKEAVEHNRQNELQLLEQAKKVSLGDMIGNIAHQWRQPLTIISTAATGLLFKLENKFKVSEEEYIELFTKVNDSTQFLSDTINTFRDFVKEKKELKNVVLQERIKTILEIVGASLENNYINFTINIGDDPIEITTVVGELDQVIINIVHNARDILLERNIESPWVMLDVIDEDDNITITIEDNGGGIDEEIIDKIFEPYFTTRHQYQGTGLGLHMSRKIIEDSLKGKLNVKNTSRGAKFFITVSKSGDNQLSHKITL